VKILTVIGTRPEAIKMAPVIRALAREPSLEVRTCSTGQHREMLRPALDLFGIAPDWDLDLMTPDQSPNALVARILQAIDRVLETYRPDRVLVHGDTSSALAATVAAFHRGVPVGHVEAGLRTHDLSRPFPEEMNRRTIDGMADLLFAPTADARANLLAEGLAGRRIVTTGNTVVDALTATRAMLHDDPAFAADFAARFPLMEGKRLLLVTGHRRENFGDGLAAICRALARLAERGDIHIVYPLHLNPKVRGPVTQLLGELDGVSLIEPLAYRDFVWMMDRAHAILTDSGGVQEEAPSLDTPVLVTRDVTERPEAVAVGAAQLVGTDEGEIVTGVSRLFDRPSRASGVANPYGDGRASERIVNALMGRAVDEFVAAVA
jgi:UDP-N-acetylglucosamine 2-epimerase (non-hydrolysing)